MPRTDLTDSTIVFDLDGTLVDTVYAHVRNLRKKLGRFRRAVRSVHGVGYKLAVDGARAAEFGLSVIRRLESQR